MSTARQETAKNQARYKKNFDARLSNSLEEYHPGDYVFVRKEHVNPRKESRHKIAPVALGPYKVISVNEHTTVIEDGDERERVTRDRVVLAPIPPEVDPVDPVNPGLGTATTGLDSSEEKDASQGNAAHRGLLDLPAIVAEGEGSPDSLEEHRDASPATVEVEHFVDDNRDVGRSESESLIREILVDMMTQVTDSVPRGNVGPLGGLGGKRPTPSWTGENRVSQDCKTLDTREIREKGGLKTVSPPGRYLPSPSGATGNSRQSKKFQEGIKPPSVENQAVQGTPQESKKGSTENDPSNRRVTPQVEKPHVANAKPRERSDKSKCSNSKFGVWFSQPLVTHTIPPYVETSDSESGSQADEPAPCETRRRSPRLRGRAGSANFHAETKKLRTEKKKPQVSRGLVDVLQPVTRRSTRLREEGALSRTSLKVLEADRASGLYPHPHLKEGSENEAQAESITPPRATPNIGETVLEDEYVLDHIVDHGDVEGQTRYRVRWYGYDPSEDTWEPIHHLPRSRIVLYCRRNGIPLPGDIGKAQVG